MPRASRTLRTRTGLAIHHTPARTGAATASLLLVHGYGQNKHAWDLPSRSVDEALAAAGFDVFNLELRGHGASRHLPRASSIEDYIALDLPEAVQHIREGHADVGAPSRRAPLFLLGHSLGGLVCYATGAALAGDIAGIVTFGSPYHFGKGSRPLRALAPLIDLTHRTRVFSRRDAPVPLQIFGRPLMALHPLVERGGVYARATRPFLPVRPWHPGTIEADVLREHVELAFDHATVGETQQMFAWANAGSFRTKGLDYEERFQKWEGPLLVVSGTYDELAPPAGVRVAYNQTRSLDRTYLEVPHGHIDMLVGKQAEKTVWEPVRSWLQARSA